MNRKVSVYERIRDAILEGRLEAGTALPENLLAVEYGISRTPIREALHRLEAEKLVERGPGGAVVRAPKPEEILDVYDVRITLEGMAARRAAIHATEFDLVTMRAKQEEMRELDDPSQRAALNRAFHEAIWAASHSPTLVDVCSRLLGYVQRSRGTTLRYGSRWEESLAEHDELINAIAHRDPDAAQEIGERHLTTAREIRLHIYARS